MVGGTRGAAQAQARRADRPTPAPTADGRPVRPAAHARPAAAAVGQRRRSAARPAAVTLPPPARRAAGGGGTRPTTRAVGARAAGASTRGARHAARLRGAGTWSATRASAPRARAPPGRTRVEAGRWSGRRRQCNYPRGVPKSCIPPTAEIAELAVTWLGGDGAGGARGGGRASSAATDRGAAAAPPRGAAARGAAAPLPVLSAQTVTKRPDLGRRRVP